MKTKKESLKGDSIDVVHTSDVEQRTVKRISAFLPRYSKQTSDYSIWISTVLVLLQAT